MIVRCHECGKEIEISAKERIACACCGQVHLVEDLVWICDECMYPAEEDHGQET